MKPTQIVCSSTQVVCISSSPVSPQRATDTKGFQGLSTHGSPVGGHEGALWVPAGQPMGNRAATPVLVLLVVLASVLDWVFPEGRP